MQSAAATAPTRVVLDGRSSSASSPVPPPVPPPVLPCAPSASRFRQPSGQLARPPHTDPPIPKCSAKPPSRRKSLIVNQAFSKYTVEDGSNPPAAMERNPKGLVKCSCGRALILLPRLRRKPRTGAHKWSHLHLTRRHALPPAHQERP